MKRGNAILASLLLLTMACAAPAASAGKPPVEGKAGVQSSGKEQLASSDDENTYVCERIRPTGSNIPETVCRTKKQIRQQREAAQQDLLRPRMEAQPAGGPR